MSQPSPFVITLSRGGLYYTTEEGDGPGSNIDHDEALLDQMISESTMVVFPIPSASTINRRKDEQHDVFEAKQYYFKNLVIACVLVLTIIGSLFSCFLFLRVYLRYRNHRTKGARKWSAIARNSMLLFALFALLLILITVVWAAVMITLLLEIK